MFKDEKILNMTSEDFKFGKIPVDIYKDIPCEFENIAKMIAEEIVSYGGKKAVMIMPLGPVGQYEYLANIINEKQISLANITFINMDEYMIDESTLISPCEGLSFEYQMYHLFYNKVQPHLLMPKSQRIFPNLENGDHIRKVIKDNGGVDLCVGGIGINGHVAFNEPPTDGMTSEEFVKLSVRSLEIAPETIVTNGIYEYEGAYEFMPRHAVTIGFNEIMQSKKVRLYVFKPFHKMVARKACFYPKSCEFPVTLLQDMDIRIGMHEGIL